MPPIQSGSLVRRNPLFRNFLIATTVSLLGTNIFDIAMPLYVLQKTNSAFALSLVTFGLSLPYFLMAPLTGYSADHADKRKVMLVADIGQIVCLFFLLGYEIFSGEEIWPILLTVFVTKSMMIIFESITTFQLIPALVPADDLSSANSWFLGLQRSIQVVGPLSGGVLMSVLGIHSCIIVNIVSFGATLYFTLKIKNLNELVNGEPSSPETVARKESLGGMVDNFVDNIRWVFKSPIFKPFILAMLFWNASPLIPNTPTLTYYFTAVKGLSPAKYGVVVSLVGVLGVFGYLFAGSLFKRFSFRTVFIGACVWQAALGTFAVFFAWNPMAFATTFAVSRVGSSALTMGSFLLRQTRVPRKRTGGVNSVIRMFFMSAAPLSSLLQATVIQYFTVYASLFLGAVSLWATAWYANKVAKAADTAIKSKEPAAA